jgi:hypothetical protein
MGKRSTAAIFSTLLNLGVEVKRRIYANVRMQPQKLADRYLARRSWPMSKPITALFWEVNEVGTKNKTTQKSARDLLNHILEKAPKDAPEITFAKIRVDQLSTEYESFFNDK